MAIVKERRATYECEHCGETFDNEYDCNHHKKMCLAKKYAKRAEQRIYNEDKNLIMPDAYEHTDPSYASYVWWLNEEAYNAFYDWYQNEYNDHLEECVPDSEGVCYWSNINDEWYYLSNCAVTSAIADAYFAESLMSVSPVTGEVKSEVTVPIPMPEVEKVREKWVLDNPLGDDIVILSLTEEQANLLIYLRCEGWLGEADVRAYNEPKIIII